MRHSLGFRGDLRVGLPLVPMILSCKLIRGDDAHLLSAVMVMTTLATLSGCINLVKGLVIRLTGVTTAAAPFAYKALRVVVAGV